jgi:putative restriction endonuclease
VGSGDKYAQAFAKLSVDRNRNRWPAATLHASPYKPLLLLSVMDMIAEGSITSNRIPPSIDLAETFNGYCFEVLPPGMKGNPAMPFYHLHNEGFWRRIPAKGLDRVPHTARNSMPKLMETCAYAEIDDFLFALLQNPESREWLRALLISTYFVDELRPVLFQQAVTNLEAEQYSRLLLAAETPAAYGGSAIPAAQARPARDQGFRKAMVRIYEHRCAFCGIRMMTPEGHTVVDAAHIVPWAKSQDDSPQNGLCLCKLCHWSFDEHFMHLDGEYRIKVSPLVQSGRNLPGLIMLLDGRPMILPDDNRYWPGKENIAEHRNQ